MAISPSDLDKIFQWAQSSNIEIDDTTLSKIEKYHDLLMDWNTRLNLISRNDRNHIIENHFLDSLAPLNMIPKRCRLIDIGSGAGFPGIPLAIFRPDAYITLLESVHKKAIFLQAAIDNIGLSNTIILEKRLEQLSPGSNYDIATIRALPKRELMMPHAYRVLAPEGKIILFIKRGQYSLLENQQS